MVTVAGQTSLSEFAPPTVAPPAAVVAAPAAVVAAPAAVVVAAAAVVADDDELELSLPQAAAISRSPTTGSAIGATLRNLAHGSP